MVPEPHKGEKQGEEKQIKLADLKLIKALLPFLKPYLWMLMLSTLLVFLVTFFDLLMPIFTQKAFDGFIVPVDPEKGIHIFGVTIESFQTFCILFCVFILTSFIIDFIQTIFMEYTGQKIILNLRCALFSHMTFLPVRFYDKNSSGRLVSRVAGDIENMNEMFTSILIFIFKDLMLMAAILVILFTINTKLALYLSALIPVIIISISMFSNILRTAFRGIRQKIAEINHSFSEALTGIKIIQTTSSRKKFMQRFELLNFEHFTAALFQIKIFSIFMPFVSFLGVLSVAIIIWTGSFEVMKDSLTLGGLVAFLTYMKLFFRPLRELSEKFNLLQNALASAERIITILNNDQAKQRINKKRIFLDKISSITFDQVNFSYKQDKIVLKDISFDLSRGKSIGIVGQTGSGKSSIINLITGFYQPDNGNILINHINYQSVNIEDIRSRTALVMQDPVLFSGSIRDNIKPFQGDMNNSRLEKALYNANCKFLFTKFSGLDTRIEEGGRPLSSGEKQLVCIARAFAFNPDLIIFDEATSYMDSQSEQKVHDAMKKLMKGRLSIIIAHRLSTVKQCDNILLLRDGSIQESGSHQELAALKGEYYHLLQKEKI
ncbi:ABC transporter ATP-binding protein [Desulfobacula toluolica]|uniref:ABC transporter ATP-binding protein n=1 Tax=Desulfobacula toluolica TaxID=28223 RepID=UPI00068441FF|nr:ABC transporter ATP-binding protein [Desulfobacula toluolica]